jgi:hypothetical protein
MLFSLVIYDKGELKSRVANIPSEDIFKTIPPYVTSEEGWIVQREIVSLLEHEYYRLAHNSKKMMNVYVVRQPEVLQPEPESVIIPVTTTNTLTHRTQQIYAPLPESDDEDGIPPSEIISCFDRICKKIRRILIRITTPEY